MKTRTIYLDEVIRGRTSAMDREVPWDTWEFVSDGTALDLLRRILAGEHNEILQRLGLGIGEFFWPPGPPSSNIRLRPKIMQSAIISYLEQTADSLGIDSLGMLDLPPFSEVMDDLQGKSDLYLFDGICQVLGEHDLQDKETRRDLIFST